MNSPVVQPLNMGGNPGSSGIGILSGVGGSSSSAGGRPPFPPPSSLPHILPPSMLSNSLNHHHLSMQQRKTLLLQVTLSVFSINSHTLFTANKLHNF